ncbi:LysR family transcriptional regulator [Xylophilus sp. GW821-FHT01B05]
MEFAQLRQFLAVADALHFGQAAEQLGMAQPHLSRAIAKLEAELGVPLFLRTSRRVQLTPAGESLRDEATELLRGEQRARSLALQADRAHARRLRIAFVSAALYRLLPALVRELRSDDAGLHIELQEAPTEEQLELLARGEIDLGLGHLPVPPHARISSELLINDRFDALLPSDHPQAEQAAISFAELAAHAFVLFPQEQGPALHALIRDQCRLAGRELVVAQTASRLHSQCALIAGGLGVGLAPVQSRSLAVEGTVRLPIKPYPASLSLGLAAFWDPRIRHGAQGECLERLRRLARDSSPAQHGHPAGL